MPLALITPTRRRWNWLTQQAEAIAPQLRDDDRWIIAIDNDVPEPGAVERITRMVGEGRLVWLDCSYARPVPPVACVNHLRNAATALAPPEADIVEVDDHDLLTPYALSEIRAALEAGYDYVFGWQHQQALIEGPNGKSYVECWPDVCHAYEPGGFERREIDAIGVRGFTRWLWDRLGGWDARVWPGGDHFFALRAERIAARIVCLEQFLCTVLIDPQGLSGQYRETCATA